MTDPQKVVVQTIQQLYSGDPQQMVQALENSDSDMSGVKRKIEQDLQTLHSLSKYAPEIAAKQGTINIRGKIRNTIHNEENRSNLSLQMVNYEINQVYHSYVIALHQVNGEWKLSEESMRQLVGAIYPKYKPKKKKENMDDLGYGLGDAIQLDDMHDFDIQMHRIIYEKINFEHSMSNSILRIPEMAKALNRSR